MATVPQSITTDSRGTGQAALFRNLAAFAVGSTFDIHFRVIEQASQVVVLESACYQFVVTQWLEPHARGAAMGALARVLRRRAVALLELLAAAAGAWVVAPDARVGIDCKRRLG